MSAPMAPAPMAPAEPSKGLSIAGVVFAFLIPLLGLILSIVALVQSRGVGQKNGLAVAGIIISIVWPIVIGIIVVALSFAGLAAACGQYGPGVHVLDNGTTLTCG
ncbi:MAG: hypothetical protein ABI435_03370 [Pseudolysinimonas sp.]